MSTEITELPDKGRRRQVSDQKRQVPKIKNLLRKRITTPEEGELSRMS